MSIELSIEVATSNRELVSLRHELTKLEEACTAAWEHYKDGPVEQVTYDVLNAERSRLQMKYFRMLRECVDNGQKKAA